MPWIRVIEPEEASGKLKEAYEEIIEKRGKVSNIMKIQSLNPRAMMAHLDLYVGIMFGRSKLSREEREMLATAVSTVNQCDYCQIHHGEALNYYWKDKNRVEQFINDLEGFNLSKRLRRMIDYGIKLTKSPQKMSKKDIDSLRDVGFSDDDILLINMIVAYFNFVNRIALGLGVEFSEEEITGYKY